MRSKGEEGEPRWREPRPPFVTGYAGATFTPGKENPHEEKPQTQG